MQPRRTKKITQPLRTKKSRNLSGQKNHATSLDKKNTEHLGTQTNYATFEDKKNHATSWDKKKSRNLNRQKNHTNFRDKKNPATSWNKKKSRNLLGQKNHATSQDKTITQPLGPKKNNATSRDGQPEKSRKSEEVGNWIK